MDDATLRGTVERTIISKIPFTQCDREKDYEIVWAEFEAREVIKKIQEDNNSHA